VTGRSAAPIEREIGEGDASARFIAPVAMELPPYLKRAEDPVFGTTFERITQPGRLGAGVTCSTKYCTHRYSSAQAWNADQSVLVIVNGCSDLCFLDGQTFAPLFRREHAGECEWHPKSADLMICVAGRVISTWNPRANTSEALYVSPDHDELQFGPSKGNPSRDGSRIAVRALDADGKLVVFAFDLNGRHKFPDIELSRLPGTNDACTISPLGDDIVCFQDLSDDREQTFIFDVDGRLVQLWAEHHRPGHGDITVDADGSEVYVGISKSDPDKYQVIKRRLSDGAVTVLMAYGEAEHASMRALDRPGWVILSYAGDPDEVAGNPSWAPYARELIALRIDGSRTVRRIAQTHNVPFDYWSETHASPSPDGSQIVWSSNWGTAGGPVYDFVSRVDWAN
jgi:hypothetical protein